MKAEQGRLLQRIRQLVRASPTTDTIAYAWKAYIGDFRTKHRLVDTGIRENLDQNVLCGWLLHCKVFLTFIAMVNQYSRLSGLFTW